MARNLAAKARQRLLRERLEREAWLGRRFLELVNFCRFFSLHNEGDQVRIEATDMRGRYRVGEGRDFPDILAAAMGEVRTKECHGPCGRTLPFDAFAHDRNRPDGRLLRCKRCEAERLREYKSRHQDRRTISTNQSSAPSMPHTVRRTRG